MTSRLATLLAAALLFAGHPASAGHGSRLVSGPGSNAGHYTQPVTVVHTDGSLLYTNLDLFPHDVVAYDTYGPDDQPWCTGYPVGRCPAFWSEEIGIGQETPVLGLSSLQPGRVYLFYCTTHPNMRGRLLAL